MVARRMRIGLLTAVLMALMALVSCDTSGGQQASGGVVDDGPELFSVAIKGEAYRLELALDNETRVRGLSGRESIPARGGMLFVFPNVQQHSFVMRDCFVDIDIAYLDSAGKVVSLHAMVVQLREEGESDAAYERRLRRYSSFYGAAYAVEVIGGTWKRIGLVAGETIEFDRASVKARVR